MLPGEMLFILFKSASILALSSTRLSPQPVRTAARRMATTEALVKIGVSVKCVVPTVPRCASSGPVVIPARFTAGREEGSGKW